MGGDRWRTDAIVPGAVAAVRAQPGLGADALARILGGNAAALLGLSAAA